VITPEDRARRPAPLLALAAGLFLPLALAAGLSAVGAGTIERKGIEAHVGFLAAPGMEGRDTPSEGLRRAARYVAGRFAEFGLEPAPDSVALLTELGREEGYEDAEGEVVPSFLRPFRLRHETPAGESCSLMLIDGGEQRAFDCGSDYVPLSSCEGSARGELVFAGFGIRSSHEKYDDLKGLRLKGAVALIFDGEPRHKKKFDGEETTEAASLWSKLEDLAGEGVAGVLVARRAPEGSEDEENRLDFRHSFARFPGENEPRLPQSRPPVLEIAMECASELLGTDAVELAGKMDRSGRPTKVKLKGREISMDSRTTRRDVRVDNVVGVIRGSDEALCGEYVLLGAHYDHIGVDPRGRVGCGADDNASGTAGMLAVVEALAADPPRRSILACAFAGEEDGLLGSREIAQRLPVERGKVVAMINLDMLGFGDADEVAVLGTKQNPELEQLLTRAKRLSKTGVREVVTGKGEDLFQRSDHYSFHQIGLPVLFFFEGLPISRNKDYHTWRDRLEGLDTEKITRSARLVYNTVWLLATDDERPPPPRE